MSNDADGGKDVDTDVDSNEDVEIDDEVNSARDGCGCTWNGSRDTRSRTIPSESQMRKPFSTTSSSREPCPCPCSCSQSSLV